MGDVKSRKGKKERQTTTTKKTTTKTLAGKCHLSGTHSRVIGCQFTPIVFHWPLVRGLVSLMSKRNVIVSL